MLIGSCTNFKQFDDIFIVSSLEHISSDKKFILADNDTLVKFKGAQYISNDVSKNGSYSLKLDSKNKFGLAIEFPNVSHDYYVNVSIWRKSENPNSYIVISTPDKQYYKQVNKVIDVDQNGWEKLNAVYYLPANLKTTTLKINIWNAGGSVSYFDDLSIEIKKRYNFPVFKEKYMHIEVDTSAYIKLQKIRIRSFKNGILQSQDDDWIKGFLFYDSIPMKCDLRLKGDWLDHLYGEKWSFRIKLKKDDTWNRMKVFSVQNPMSRMGVYEWFAHQVFMDESLLTTRYGFIPVTFKNTNLGIYAWEEHFTKQLIESQMRREGPIVRFNEDAMWDTRTFMQNGKRNYASTPFFSAAAITPFSKSKLINDSAKLVQFNTAARLMKQYKEGLNTASDIFNIDLLAKYFAFSDVFDFRHGIIWHNQRFYYNPVLCKLEPIAFDCFSDVGLHEKNSRIIWGYTKDHGKKFSEKGFLHVRKILNDKKFMYKYIEYLEKYSSVNYLNSITLKHHDSVIILDNIVTKEFPQAKFDTAKLFFNASRVRKLLPEFKSEVKKYFSDKNLIWVSDTLQQEQFENNLDDSFLSNLVNCYLEKSTNDSNTYLVENFFSNSISILGFGKNNDLITQFVVPNEDLASRGLEGSKSTVTVKKADLNYVFINSEHGNEIITSEVYKWKKPTQGPTPQQLLVKNYQAEQYTFISIKDDVISLNRKDITLRTPLIIPEGYKFILEEGTNINLHDSAMIISYSPVYFNGTKTKPVIIRSDDFTANAFTVLQADKRSKLENVRFENMNTLNYKGWTLTGAVTFYESDVDLNNVYFYRNQCEDALNIVRSDFTLTNCGFQYTWGDAFDSDFSTGTVEKVYFDNIGNDAIDFSGSQIAINNTTINSAQDKGISGGEESHLTVSNCVINNSNIGIASKDLSLVEVDNTSVNDCNYGLVLLQKKPEYGPAKIILNSVNFKNPKTEKLIEFGSEVIQDGKTIKGKQKNVASLFY